MANAKVVTFRVLPSGQIPNKPMKNPPRYAAVYVGGTNCRIVLPLGHQSQPHLHDPPKRAYLRLGVVPPNPSSGQEDFGSYCDWNCDNYCDCETACESICGTACDCYCYCDCADCNCACDCETECSACYCSCE
ncbi:MAG: hypothetical protein ACYTG0_07405 [Planctomycetota bacterium]|jgi:hypothetical protein